MAIVFHHLPGRNCHSFCVENCVYSQILTERKGAVRPLFWCVKGFEPIKMVIFENIQKREKKEEEAQFFWLINHANSLENWTIWLFCPGENIPDTRSSNMQKRKFLLLCSAGPWPGKRGMAGDQSSHETLKAPRKCQVLPPGRRFHRREAGG